jgi:hypothetical protein
MFWWIFLGFSLIILLVLLFAPFKLSINSVDNLYFVSWGNFLKAAAWAETNDISFRFSLFGFSKRISLMEMIAKPRKHKSIQERVTNAVVKKSSKKVPFKLVINLLKSFRVKQFYINIDFHSYWNAWIYPLGEIFRRENFYISTNFMGKTEVEIEIINRPAWMIWAIIKSSKNKKS